MSGGGAHAAYQVGVLRALVRILPRHAPNPFSIYCGTSAGAINCATLAVHADDLRAGVRRLTHIWGHFAVGQVFTVDWGRLAANAARWSLALASGGAGRPSHLALLDRRPLADLLTAHLRLASLETHIRSGALHALSVTCSSYTTGRSLTFFEGARTLSGWHRAGREGVATRLTHAHLLASSAIPLVFAPVLVDGDYCGDGSMRQTAPLSSALHLGAQRVFVIAAHNPEHEIAGEDGPPSLARIAGHILNSLFLASLDADLEQMERINQTVRALTRSHAAVPAGLCEIACLTVHPSANLAAIASHDQRALPRSLRFFLGIGHARRDSVFASYLLFERAYCRRLMSLGYADAMARADAIRAFLEGDTPVLGSATG